MSQNGELFMNKWIVKRLTHLTRLSHRGHLSVAQLREPGAEGGERLGSQGLGRAASEEPQHPQHCRFFTNRVKKISSQNRPDLL